MEAEEAHRHRQTRTGEDTARVELEAGLIGFNSDGNWTQVKCVLEVDLAASKGA
jgi:hypothetical protein